jgi:hypothetical protein
MAPKKDTTIKIVQIQVGQWNLSDEDGLGGHSGFSVIGLGDDGVVYQYKKSGINAWVPFNHRFLTDL